VLQQGHVVQVGNVQEIFLSPATPTVARLVGQDNIFGGHVTAPPVDKPGTPSRALRLNWLQSNGTQVQLEAPRRGRLIAPTADLSACWLPLPPAVSPPVYQSLVTGCILNDEVQVHRWSGSGAPSTWTARGAMQWLAELVEAQIQGPSMRLLVRPRWAGQSANDDTAEGCILKIYLSRSRWREVEVTPGQLLLLEIGPEAIHFFVDNVP
jgi:hypothetical protein